MKGKPILLLQNVLQAVDPSVRATFWDLTTHGKLGRSYWLSYSDGTLSRLNAQHRLKSVTFR